MRTAELTQILANLRVQVVRRWRLLAVRINQHIYLVLAGYLVEEEPHDYPSLPALLIGTCPTGQQRCAASALYGLIVSLSACLSRASSAHAQHSGEPGLSIYLSPGKSSRLWPILGIRAGMRKHARLGTSAHAVGVERDRILGGLFTGCLPGNKTLLNSGAAM
jgi:hypothetical protein